MKNTINILVVCCKKDLSKIKEDISATTSEVNMKYTAEHYKDALSIINNKDNYIDAIIVDGTLPGENILSFITGYKNEHMYLDGQKRETPWRAYPVGGGY